MDPMSDVVHNRIALLRAEHGMERVEMAPTWAEAQGIAAKAVTPFLLDRIFALTEGRSLQANIALVLSNARLAARIASPAWPPTARACKQSRLATDCRLLPIW